MLNKFNNLNLNVKNIIVLSSLIMVFLIVNISTSINNYFETFNQEQEAKVYSLLQASITASNNILKDQEDPNATKLLKREFVQEFLSSTNKKQTVLSSKLYHSNPFVSGEILGNQSANDSKVKIIYQQENANFEKNKLNDFSKEAIKNSKNKLFHFSLNENTKLVEAFYGIKVSKNMLSEYGDISNDLDGDGFNSLGFKMPGWKEGEIHSGFYAKIDISENISNLYSSIFISAIIQILVGVVLIFIFVNLLRKSTSYSLNKIKLGLDSFFSFLNRESNSCKTIEVTTNDILGQMAISINENIENTQVVIKEDNTLIDEAQKVIDEVKVGNLDNFIKSTTSNKSLEAFKNDVNEMILVTKNHFQKINEILEQYAKYNYLNELNLGGIKKGSAFDSLSKDINTLKQAITEMLVENKKNGLVLTQSSEVLINNVAVLNQNSSSAAASLEETAAALDEITSNVSNNNIHVREMASLASKLTNSANEGQSLASKTTEAMDEINNEVEAINNAISIIDQIAFQTNILSLNAAVEAATAGEAGKGFAVVAGEVRNLASRSAEAAKEIKELIEKATLKATEGKNISDEMIKGYEELNNNVIKTTKLISDIDTASKEQETGILQINDTVNSLDKQTQENANIAEQTNSIASQTDKISKVIIQNANQKEFVGKDSVKID